MPSWHLRAQAQAHLPGFGVNGVGHPAALCQFGVEEHRIAVVVDDQSAPVVPLPVHMAKDGHQRRGRRQVAHIDVPAVVVAEGGAGPLGWAAAMRGGVLLRGLAGEIATLDATVTGLHKAAYWQRVYRRYGVGSQGQRHFLVAEMDGRVCGFVIGEVRDWEFGAPPCGWLFAIDVMPSARQMGVGALLLAALAQRFRRVGVNTLRTIVASSNAMIQSFFRSQGMRAGHLLPLEMNLEAEQGGLRSEGHGT